MALIASGLRVALALAAVLRAAANVDLAGMYGDELDMGGAYGGAPRLACPAGEQHGSRA